MKKCIYSKKTESEAKFDSGEHVFPAAIGGIACLPNEYVSAETNNEFSKIELHFAREYPPIMISRMFLSHTGRKKHKNRDRIVALRSESDNEMALGYIREGKPCLINQMIFSDSGQELKIKIDSHINKNIENTCVQFIEKLKTYDSSPVIIRNDEIDKTTYLLGVNDERWYLGINSDKDEDESMRIMLKMISQITEDLFSVKSQTGNICNVEASINVAIDLEYVYRVLAKIAFNSLAYLKGQDYVLKSEFDGIREAILTGKNIYSYFPPQKPDCTLPLGQNILKNVIDLGENYHFVAFINLQNKLVALLSLYGSSQIYLIQFSSCYDEQLFDMFVCDWENKKEYSLRDISNILSEQINDNFNSIFSKGLFSK